MKKIFLSLTCVVLILVVASMAWLYQTRPEVLLNSTLGKIISPTGGPPWGFGNAVAVRESSVVLAQVQAKGLLASGAYDGRIIYSINDANYTASGLQWPWNNIIEIVNVNKGRIKRESHAMFRDKYDFAFSPHWLGSSRVLFSAGEIGSYSSSDFVEWNPTTGRVRTVAKGLASGPVVPSPNGRFYAYIEGGHSYPIGPADPQYLRIRDMNTGKVVGKSLGLSNFAQMSWLSSDILLFNLRDSSKNSREYRDAIWQINASSGTSKPFRKDAFSATASPDGKWFTCLSYDNPATRKVERATPLGTDQNSAAKPQPFTLVLSSADQRVVKTVTNKLISFVPDVVWETNSKRFAIYETSRRNSVQSSKPAEDIVRIYDVKSKTLKRIDKLRRPPQKIIFGNTETIFCRPLSFTRDGRFLLFSIRNLDGPSAGTTLAAFDTKSGATQTWFYTSADGLSWLEN